jgi:hypothetical protein
LNGTGALTGGSATTSAGIAAYPALQIDQTGSSDSLTASVSLNNLLSPPLAITATSSSFAVLALPTVSAVSVTPSAGYGITQQFSFVASSTSGAGDLAFVYMLFNPTVTRLNGCYLTYVASGNQLSLLSNDGATSTSGHPGAIGTLSNSQCSVDLSTTMVSASGNTLTVSPMITFQSGFTPGLNIYMYVIDIPGLSSG